MRRRVLRNLFLASSLVGLAQLMTPTDADAEARLALVIGQSAYRTVPELPNAANDAKGMTELLGNAGFTVTTAANLAQNEMRAAISDFAGRSAQAAPTPSHWCSMPATASRSTARTIWCRSISIPNARPTFRSRACG